MVRSECGFRTWLRLRGSALAYGWTAAGVLLGDDDALRGGRVELTDERIAARRKGPDENRGLGFPGNHFLAVERMAVELLGRGVLVVDDEPDLDVRRHADLRWRETVVANRQREFRDVRRNRGGDEQ